MKPQLEIIARFLSFLCKLITGVQARWLNTATIYNRKQKIFFSNHSSHLDAIVIWSSLPPEIQRLTRPVAARDYWQRYAIRRFLAVNVFKCILIDRPAKDKEFNRASFKSIEKIENDIKNKYSLIVFPEGTRSDGIHIGKFKAGLYHLAKIRPDIELVPVFIENLNRILPKGEFLPVPILSSITFGQPICLKKGGSKKEFLDRAHKAVLNLREL